MKVRVGDILRKAVPTVVAVAIFGIVSIVGFAPQLEGRVLPQHDVRQFDGMSRDIRECRAEFGEDPQWTGAMFSGMPAYQINIKYPAQIIKRTVDWVQSLFAEPASMLFFAMLGAFVAALLMGMSAWVGLIVGLSYGLSTYFFLIIGAGHITKMWALVYAPPMLGAIHYTLRRNMWLGGALTALFASLEVGANHPQISYYFVLVAAALFISELIYALRERRIKEFAKRTALLAAAALVALGSNFAPLYYTMQHTGDTVRGGSAVAEREEDRQGLDVEYATAWSYGIDESLNMLVPDLMGGDSGRTFSRSGAVAKELSAMGVDRSVAEQLPAYWGEQPYTAGPTYIGAVVLFLALLGLLLSSARDRWWVVAAVVLSLLMAWGYHAMWFTRLCFDYLPLYNKFRAVSTALVIIEWCAPLMAGVALWQVCRQGDDKRRIKRAICIAGGVVAALCFVLAVAGGQLFDFAVERDGAMMSEQFRYMFESMDGGAEYIARGMNDEMGWRTAEAMAAERADILAADAWRSLLFVLAAAALLLGSLYMDAKWRKWGFAAMALLVMVDILPVNLRYLPYDSFVVKHKVESRPSAADRAIMADKELGFRVLNLSVSPFNDATTSLYHRSVGGYHGAKMGRYQDVIDRYLTRGNEEVFDMLNTKYVISREGEALERSTQYGAAWFVSQTVVAATPTEELAALGEYDLRDVAVVAEADAAYAEPSLGRGTIELVEYRPNRLLYRYSLEGGEATAIFSEIFYDKGWCAYLDGEQVPYFRADYLLRAIRLPAGEHTVEWRFRAPSWDVAEGVTLVCSLLIIVMLIVIVIYRINEKRKEYKA